MLYLANVWNELFAERGLSALDSLFGSTVGNWLAGSRRADLEAVQPDFVVVAPANFDQPLDQLAVLSRTKFVLVWVLFPGDLLGWDFCRYEYGRSVNQRWALPVSKFRVAANSSMTASALRLAGVESEVCPLGVDTKSIGERLNGRSVPGYSSTTVLWNHQWRTNKGVVTAFKVILRLAASFPNVQFYLGRCEQWGDDPEPVEDRREAYEEFQRSVVARDLQNICVLQEFVNQEDYWSLLASVDIAFSCSREESFGVGMLECAAARIACVVPQLGAYPEVLPGAYFVEGPTPRSLVDGVGALIIDRDLRARVADACYENAQRYDVVDSAQNLGTILQSLEP